MRSTNFEFLRDHAGELADLGGFAEHYAHSDPPSSLAKLRSYAENMVAAFYEHYGLPRDRRSNFVEDLQNATFRNSVPAAVLSKLHAIRMQGNQALHGKADDVSTQTAMWILKEAFSLGKWFCVTLYDDERSVNLEFRKPEPDDDETKGRLKREKKAALQKLAAQEAKMQQLLQELKEQRDKAAAAEKTEAERIAILQHAEHAADILQFSEEETRTAIIDQMLMQAGWDVNDPKQVGREVKVQGQPTASGKGRADYVLWDDNQKPLAVIEAKKTARNSELGRTQAKLYADGLEQEYDQRPVIFYTNGYDIYVWDDAKGEVPRSLFGYYNKDSLRYCHWKNDNRQEPLEALNPKEEIVNRIYQIEAIKRISNRLDNSRRKALVVQATGTGKTRVAVALCELMIRAFWAKRVLFLCDRRELQKQAKNAFSQFLGSEPYTYVNARTSEDRQKSIYLATYPAMLKCFQGFDVGFFDLIIADESHRSIYNRYRELFQYFDAVQVGLTATPVSKITRNTFKMFNCEEGDPTAHYSYEDAINDSPPYLVPFHVVSMTTKFLREGIKYNEMSSEQQEELDDQVEDSELVDYEREDVDKAVFNKDTDRHILRNLMQDGVRNASGSHVGKTIVFARNHDHAVSLLKLFEEMYPQYMKPKKEFCAVIDNYEPRAEQLIDDFKGNGNNDNLTIAISVDMLDTGIDVPEVVNLVFAKPIKSYVKFWQMIGRGTRLCTDLFGPGRHKEYFQIFDHWGNFEWFGENPPEYEPAHKKSLLQKLFEARISLAEATLEKQKLTAFETAVDLIARDVNRLPMETIAVREKWRQVKRLQQEGVIKEFAPATVQTLKMQIAPLMQWVDLDGREDAYRFDLLLTRLEETQIRRTSDFDDFRDLLQQQVSQLPINLSQVANKEPIITTVKTTAFWDELADLAQAPQTQMAAEPADTYEVGPIRGATATERLETVRRELRGIMHCRNKPKRETTMPLEIDVTDTDIQTQEESVKLEGLDLVAYRKRVKGVFDRLVEDSAALQKIKRGQAVAEDEIGELIRRAEILDPDLRVDELLIQFPNQDDRLDLAIRQIIGMDGEAVNEHFSAFVQKYPDLSSHQIRFLEMIKKQIANYGALQLDMLYKPPFTQIDSEGVDAVFPDDAQVDDLLELIDQINTLASG